ncbi:MAG: tRNA (adenosine(37)-N6)-threonylcarbamoyltransferase complex dimerization subunit type 1 TsaB [Desulfobacterium sp.]|nr:tRNA (adenosine(37)-N6)-threonylcarbamoyltransferase complex dimerization subunit type 1 TsaB [Desulfobacterium sp.]
MKIIAVNTAETSASVALVEDGMPVCEEFFSSRVTHSRVLMEMVEQMLTRRALISVAEVDGFVAARGPGSFTGLRIGISVVKGLAYATSKPVAGISSLDGIAWQMAWADRPVLVMMDAKRGEVYCARYGFSNGRLVEKTEELCVSPEKAVALAGGSAVFAGSGALVYRELIEAHIHGLGKGSACFVPGFQNQVRAVALAHALFQDTGRLSDDPASILPVYIRRSDAEINYEKHPDRFC